MDVLNVLIVDIQYADKFMTENVFQFPIEVKRRVARESIQLIRAMGVEATYKLSGAESFIESRFPGGPTGILDYSSGRGVEAAFVADLLKAKRLVITTLTGKEDQIPDDIKHLSGVEILPIQPSEPPRTEDLYDVVTVNDVLNSIESENVLALLEGLVNLTTENGIVVVMLTDGISSKIDEIRESFKSVSEAKPELLDKVVFVLQHKQDHKFPQEVDDHGLEILSHHSGDMGDKLKNDKSHKFEAIFNQIKVIE